MALVQQKAQTPPMFTTLIAGMPKNNAPKPAVALSIIQVMPVQSEVKRMALMRVQAILQLFDPGLRALAWRISEKDHSGAPQSYDMKRATENHNRTRRTTFCPPFQGIPDQYLFSAL